MPFRGLMQPHSRQGLKFIPILGALVLASLLLSGCLVKLAYQNIDTLLLWKIDSYFDLSASQSRDVERQLEEQIRWHRSDELPKMIEFFKRVQVAAQYGITLTDLEQLFSNFNMGVASIALHISADAAQLFARMDDEQIKRLERELAKTNEEWEDRLALPPDKRLKEREKRIIDYVENWVGDLSKEQRVALTEASRKIPDILEGWLEYRRERQRQFINIVRSARFDVDIVRIALPQWVTTEPPKQFQEHHVAVQNFILEVARTATPDQKKYFTEKLQNWIDDLQTFTDKPA